MTRNEGPGSIPGIEKLENFIDYRFENRNLLVEALTHASFSNENGMCPFNERLEFLGDAVLGLCVTAMIYKKFPDEDEGAMSGMKASIVCEDALYAWSVRAGIPGLLRLGRGLSQSGGSRQPVICADAAEAVFGAVFLDGGYGAAEKVIGSYYVSSIEANVGVPRNAKAVLQEMMEQNGLGKPEYIVAEKSGPPHAPVFRVNVFCSGGLIGEGEGRTIREAERKAAEKALSCNRLHIF
ncbi:MAG TPA: ribonuclease III [Thermovirgaceae bacterium]|nr:ribonuclease III [Thermovirgaceae bacterium]